MSGPSRRQSHVDDTHRALLRSARRRFGMQGYSATSLDDVAADAGLTKGALYHHFAGKEQLFLAVYDQVEAELSAFSAAAAADAADPVDALRRGFAAFLDRAMDAEVRRIALLDAAAVLGMAAKLEVDARHSLAGVRRAVELGIAAELLEPLDPESVARLLLAACSEAALLIATHPDPSGARQLAGLALDRLLIGLAPRAQPTARPPEAGGTRRPAVAPRRNR